MAMLCSPAGPDNGEATTSETMGVEGKNGEENNVSFVLNARKRFHSARGGKGDGGEVAGMTAGL